ncbi:D-lactate dehydrogenase [Mycoplasmopsis californica]|uniref:2-hydroxyacid dehydrogenase n=1 Tax=Mycoplasmopsis equigenitalium TaxID=114883 RepID=A0ABY5J495_9BACT|nr:NAD(P)-dependent oxidoreductase [Mycoplasmopsis equigenitalium]UUD36711.1 2-hydroxyacid dehydrogenase [Mycoplasmopsis equigenitalium]VEU69994.1 D-lactate dehydrogenase [Mycoplasmopsis californica]
MKIAFFDAKEHDIYSFNKANVYGKHEITFFKENLTIETASLAKGYDAICAFVNTSGDKFILELLAKNNVKFWLQRSMGYNKVDLAYAAKVGIKVFRVPNYSASSVAEFALTTLLTLNRKIPVAINRVKNYNFSLNNLNGKNIENSIIGVIGAGQIGQEFIRMANGLKAKVIVYDQFMQVHNFELAKKMNFEYVSFLTLIKNSDFISLHAPLLPSTRYIIDKHAIKYMKKDVIIVNTGRGELIKLTDILAALKNNKIGGLAVDVLEREEGRFYQDISNLAKDIQKIDKEWKELLELDNVIVTSHQAFLTDVSLEQIAKITIDNADAAEAGNFEKALELLANGKVKNG